ncbi:radical SAM protein [Candidatus Woesearchaeota archaeon]|nr:radical SAM protein [Candidatus Woesearchaeota archaeon]
MNLAKIALNSYVLKKEPISLIHFVTNRCNARCKHCFIDFDHPDVFKGELSLEEIEKLTKSFGRSMLNVNLTGGEPFLRKDFFEIVKLYFNNANIKSVYITTNGMFTKLTKDFLDKFIASRINGNMIISFSIDNFEQQHDENRRVKGLYQNTLRTYELVKSYNKPNIMANIAITVTDHNYDKVIDLYHYLKNEKGVNSFTAIAMREEGVIKNIDPEIKKRIYETYIKLTSLIQEDMLKRETKGYKDGLQGTLLNAKNMIMYKNIADTYMRPKYISHCPAGALFGVIWANGIVYPCEILNKPLGNLRDYGMNFMELWKNEQTKDVKKFIKDTDCNCTFECAWAINIISNKKYIPPLIANSIRQKI